MKRILFVIAALVIALTGCSGNGDRQSNSGGAGAGANQATDAGTPNGDVPSGGVYGSESDSDGKTGPNDSIDGDGVIDDANKDGKDMADDAKKDGDDMMNDAKRSVDDAARGLGDGAKDVIDGAENAVDDVTGGNNANNNR